MRALILVDIQNDFMPFGSLSVDRGDEVVAVANRHAPLADHVVATQDWHPSNHGSFAVNHSAAKPGDMAELGGLPQVLWPAHCVQNMPGASFHSGLDVARIDAVVRKGTDASIDSYSGFFDNAHRRDTGLAHLLRGRGITEVWLVGLATDYCVKATALDGLGEGFKVVVVEDGVRAVDVKPGDGLKALDEMRGAGCVIKGSGELFSEFS